MRRNKIRDTSVLKTICFAKMTAFVLQLPFLKGRLVSKRYQYHLIQLRSFIRHMKN